jgi:hypothetical protein
LKIFSGFVRCPRHDNLFVGQESRLNGFVGAFRLIYRS